MWDSPISQKGVGGQFSRKARNWYRITDAQRHQIRVASSKISRYLKDYADRAEARNIEKRQRSSYSTIPAWNTVGQNVPFPLPEFFLKHFEKDRIWND